MASRATNETIAELKRRQAAELEALTDVTAASGTVDRVRQRRADALERLDADVRDAEGREDMALAVLAVLRPDVAAGIADVTAARVRQAQQRAPVEEVGARVQELTGAAPPRRRGRPRGAGRPAAETPGRVPAAGGSYDDGPIAGGSPDMPDGLPSNDGNP
ncbi:hypothetical protein [Actinoplanes sp. NPDC051859]|uniref:hypothetical protein n=1 Tax=Actinoplanes sp. NPDC051859 TaxID=3363909 RepID=UPI003799FD4A